MAIRSKFLPQSRISVQSGVAAGKIMLNQKSSVSKSSVSKAFTRFGMSQGEVACRLSNRARRLNHLTRAALLTGLSVVVLSAGGCTMISGATHALKNHDGVNEFMIGHRNKTMAAKAWHCQKENFGNPSNAFKDGFIQGYLDICDGGHGCTPAIAPSQYWGWMYQSSNGQVAVNDWFAGFPMGAKAAEQDGVGHWSGVGTAHRPAGPHPAAVLPHPTAPTLLDHDDSDDHVTSPFLDDVGSDFGRPSSQLSVPVDREDAPTVLLNDTSGFSEVDAALPMQSDGGYTFSASSDGVPDLEPRFSGDTDAPESIGLENDFNIDQVYADYQQEGLESAAEASVSSTPAASSATGKLPFSFQ